MTPEEPRYEAILMPLIGDVVSVDTVAASLRAWNAVPEPTGLLLAAWVTQGDVLNGGFEQYFWNSYAVLAPEAVRGFRALGQPKTAEALEKAMARLGRVYPRDRGERHLTFADSAHPRFDDLDDEFVEHLYAENGGFEAAAEAYLDRFGIQPPDNRD